MGWQKQTNKTSNFPLHLFSCHNKVIIPLNGVSVVFCAMNKQTNGCCFNYRWLYKMTYHEETIKGRHSPPLNPPAAVLTL